MIQVSKEGFFLKKNMSCMLQDVAAPPLLPYQLKEGDVPFLSALQARMPQVFLNPPHDWIHGNIPDTEVKFPEEEKVAASFIVQHGKQEAEEEDEDEKMIAQLEEKSHSVEVPFRLRVEELECRLNEALTVHRTLNDALFQMSHIEKCARQEKLLGTLHQLSSSAKSSLTAQEQLRSRTEQSTTAAGDDGGSNRNVVKLQGGTLPVSRSLMLQPQQHSILKHSSTSPPKSVPLSKTATLLLDTKTSQPSKVMIVRSANVPGCTDISATVSHTKMYRRPATVQKKQESHHVHSELSRSVSLTPSSFRSVSMTPQVIRDTPPSSSQLPRLLEQSIREEFTENEESAACLSASGSKVRIRFVDSEGRIEHSRLSKDTHVVIDSELSTPRSSPSLGTTQQVHHREFENDNSDDAKKKREVVDGRRSSLKSSQHPKTMEDIVKHFELLLMRASDVVPTAATRSSGVTITHRPSFRDSLVGGDAFLTIDTKPQEDVARLKKLLRAMRANLLRLDQVKKAKISKTKLAIQVKRLVEVRRRMRDEPSFSYKDMDRSLLIDEDLEDVVGHKQKLEQQSGRVETTTFDVDSIEEDLVGGGGHQHGKEDIEEEMMMEGNGVDGDDDDVLDEVQDRVAALEDEYLLFEDVDMLAVEDAEVLDAVLQQDSDTLLENSLVLPPMSGKYFSRRVRMNADVDKEQKAAPEVTVPTWCHTHDLDIIEDEDIADENSEHAAVVARSYPRPAAGQRDMVKKAKSVVSTNPFLEQLIPRAEHDGRQQQGTKLVVDDIVEEDLQFIDDGTDTSPHSSNEAGSETVNPFSTHYTSSSTLTDSSTSTQDRAHPREVLRAKHLETRREHAKYEIIPLHTFSQLYDPCESTPSASTTSSYRRGHRRNLFHLAECKGPTTFAESAALLMKFESPRTHNLEMEEIAVVHDVLRVPVLPTLDVAVEDSIMPHKWIPPPPTMTTTVHKGKGEQAMHNVGKNSASSTSTTTTPRTESMSSSPNSSPVRQRPLKDMNHGTSHLTSPLVFTGETQPSQRETNRGVIQYGVDGERSLLQKGSSHEVVPEVECPLLSEERQFALDLVALGNWKAKEVEFIRLLLLTHQRESTATVDRFPCASCEPIDSAPDYTEGTTGNHFAGVEAMIAMRFGKQDEARESHVETSCTSQEKSNDDKRESCEETDSSFYD